MDSEEVQTYWGKMRVSTPMEPNAKFTTNQSPPMLNQTVCMMGKLYSKAIGSVLWPAVVSCPDIAYSVDILLQFI